MMSYNYKESIKKLGFEEADAQDIVDIIFSMGIKKYFISTYYNDDKVLLNRSNGDVVNGVESKNRLIIMDDVNVILNIPFKEISDCYIKITKAFVMYDFVIECGDSRTYITLMLK